MRKNYKRVLLVEIMEGDSGIERGIEENSEGAMWNFSSARECSDGMAIRGMIV